MLRRNERNLDNIPVGALGIVALDGIQEMGDKVNDYIVKWRREEGHAHKDDVAFSGYERDNYLINAKVPRFGSGEAKGILGESVRGKGPLPEPEAGDRCGGRKGPPDQRDHALPVRKPPAQEKPPGIPGLRHCPAGAGADGRGQYHHL